MPRKKAKKTLLKAIKKVKKKSKKLCKKQVKKIKMVSKSKPKKITGLTSKEKKTLKIKKDLLAQREALLKEAEEALNNLPGEGNFPDMGDQATAETDRNFMLRLRDRERLLLKKIDEAIERIDNGTYGICEICGNKIDIKRLEARPVTTLCIECKVNQEKEEKIMEGG